jgi:hypothetical protein
MTGFLRRVAFVLAFLPCAAVCVSVAFVSILAWGLWALIDGHDHEDVLLNPVTCFLVDLPFKLLREEDWA